VIHTIARGGRKRPEHALDISDNGGHADVFSSLSLRVDHVGDCRRPELTEAEPKVERGTKYDNKVGTLLEKASRAEERQLMISGEHPSTKTIEEARHTEVRSSGRQFVPRAVPVGVRSNQECWPLGLRYETRQLSNRILVGVDAATVACANIWHLAGRGAKHIEREIEKRRTPVWFDRNSDRFVHHLPGLLRIGHGGGELRDRLHDGYVIEFLQ
jgi:hypothetical protein